MKKKGAERWWEDVEELSAWISGIEEDGKGVPILFKQYLKLGGKIVCFNVDPQFGHTLDGLIIIDLTLTNKKIMTRYMGRDGFEIFKTHQATLYTDSDIFPRLPLDSCATT
jgi:hypothetical protein